MLQAIDQNLMKLIFFINEVTLCCPPLSAICIQETWLNEHDDISLFNLNGYNCISESESESESEMFYLTYILYTYFIQCVWYTSGQRVVSAGL